ncbi:glycosyltransferase involved in cell wall biosynthesis [Flavobacterium croceum DSM 17960]|uniref:Glycosyltransferase involved in cell wall biosynthesis n=1 Tax=Flavobacterium croceum DSM 17960 TaxID=1121886 RepID=A0A2S4N9H1_9FLAO|nr:glycosyltransferase family 4 protein [Flavobacterium croceum]POS02330.1 glycosyltransferase involved in cell wall biosynthesis [Flavobacterium croceum DSM 17960]
MTIGFLTPEFPHNATGTSGGIGSSILNLAKGLHQIGHTVKIFVYGQNNDEVVVEPEFTIYKIKNPKFKGFTRFLTQRKIQKHINALYKNKELDVLEVPDWTGFMSFFKPQCSMVVKLHGSDAYFCNLDKRPVKFLNKFHEKRNLKNADKVIAVSDFVGRETQKIFDLNFSYSVVGNAVDTQMFQPKSVENGAPIVLYFGTLIRKKGIFEIPHIFNKVVEQIPHAQLWLVGKDSFDIQTKSNSSWQLAKPMFVPQALKQTTYFGALPYQKMQEKIQESSVCIFPSYAEALPVSWLEAMAVQKPVVASNIGWATEIITPNIDGFVAYPNQYEVFAQYVINLLQNKTLVQDIAKNARKKVIQNFDLQVIAKKNAEIYSTLL